MDSTPDKKAETVWASPHASVTPALSREIVKALKHDFGRGPTQARTHILDDCVLVLMREGHTVSEHTMGKVGQQRSVAQGRVDISETIRANLVAIVEREVGRKVVGFMSSSQQDPDLISYVFVLETSPLVSAPEGQTED
jgi:uncharacterized protein YbcI